MGSNSWDTQLRASRYRPPNGAEHGESVPLSTQHLQHILARFEGQSSQEQDGFLAHALTGFGDTIDKLASGATNALDCVDMLLQRMGVVPASVGHGGRSKLHPLVASELIARVGLLVQLSLEPVPLEALESVWYTGAEEATSQAGVTGEAEMKLNVWWQQHKTDPFPNQREAIALAKDCAITLRQLATWLDAKQREVEVASKPEQQQQQHPASKTIQMSAWKGVPGLVFRASDNWQLLTIPKESGQKPQLVYYSPKGKKFTSVALIKKHLAENADSAEARHRSKEQGNVESSEPVQDRVCAECKPKHRTVDMCRVLHGHTGPNWNAQGGKREVKAKAKRKAQEAGMA